MGSRYITQMRRGTAAQWDKATIIPLPGELVVEIDEENNLHKLKIGDGIHTYSELAYLTAGDELVTQALAKAIPHVVTVTLDVDKWTEVTCETDPNLGYYGQVVALDDITAQSRLDLQPNADMLAEFQQLELAFVTENKNGTITVYSVGDKPIKTYTMQASIVETEVVADNDAIVGITVGTPTSTAELNDKVATLETQMADLLYKAISITSFSHNAGTKERGQTVTDVALSWAVSKTPTTLTLDGEALDVGARSKALTGLSITWDNNKTWTLKATDDRDAASTKTTSITFYNGVYYGATVAPDTYDSAFILGLTKTLRGNKLSPFTATAGEGQYIYYCVPTRFGTCTFTVGGFTGGFTLVDTIEFTNGSGYVENYYIYKSDSANLGQTSVTVA